MNGAVVSRRKQAIINIIPTDWEAIELDEIVLSHNSGIYKKKEIYGNGYNIVGVSDLYNTTRIAGQDFRRVPLTEEERKEYLLEEGDLIYGESSLVLEGIARSLYVTKEGRGTAFAWHTRRFKVNQNRVLPEFLYHSLNSQYARKQIMSVATQTVLTGITTKDYFGQIIALPLLPEQRCIATILSTWDTAIAQTQKLIEAKRKLKKSLMQQLLTGKRRFVSDSSKPKTVKLGEIAKIRRGASPRPIDDPKWFSNTGRGWVRISDVTACATFLQKTSQYLSALGESKSVKVNPGDLIMSICATIGVPRIVDMHACIHDGFVVLRDFEDVIDKHFLFHYISFLTDRLAHGGQPGTQRNLNTSIVGNILIPKIPLHEQRKVSDVFDAADSEIALLSRQLEALKQQKRGLMQKLLTGQIRVKATVTASDFAQ